MVEQETVWLTRDAFEKLSNELRDAFNTYVEAARGVANAISTKAPVPVYNARKDELNSARQKGIQLCKAF